MNTVSTGKNFGTYIRTAIAFLNEHKLLKYILITLLFVATCNAVFKFGENFGHFLYAIMH